MELYRSMKEISYLWVEKGGGARGGVWELCHQKFNLLTTPGARCPGQHLLASLTYTDGRRRAEGAMGGAGRQVTRMVLLLQLLVCCFVASLLL